MNGRNSHAAAMQPHMRPQCNRYAFLLLLLLLLLLKEKESGCTEPYSRSSVAMSKRSGSVMEDEMEATDTERQPSPHGMPHQTQGINNRCHVYRSAGAAWACSAGTAAWRAQ